MKKIKFSPVFQKQAIFPKFKIFRQNECTRFFRRRRSSPSSVVCHSLVRHRDGPVKKIKFSPVFQKQAIFPKFKIFRQNECTRFFRRRRSSPSSVVGHLPLSSQGRTCEKNQIFAVFQKQAIFPKFKIFRENECTRFFRRRRQLSVISLFRHRDGPVKKIKFSPFFKNKQSFQNSRFLGKMSVRDFFAVVGRRRRRSSVIYLFRHRDGPVKKIKFSPFFKNRQSFQNSRFLVEMSVRVFFGFVGRRRRRSSVISLFRHRDGPVKKIKFSLFFKNKQSFQNSRLLGKMSTRDFFAVIGRRRRRSSVIYLFRHRDGPVKKIKFSPFFKNKQSFQNSRFLGKMSVRDFFAVVGRRRRRSSVIYLFRHRDGPVKKIKFSPVFQKQAIFPKFKIIRQNECTRFFSSVVAVVGRRRRRSFQNSRFLGKMSARHFPLFVTGTDL